MNFGACILDAEGLRLSAEEKALFADVRPFGFILFDRNIDNADQVRALCDELRAAAGHECLITIDQEGGRVQRLRSPLAREWQAPLDHVAQAGEKSERAMYLRYRLIAHELRGLGIDSNCAPIADIAGTDTHPFLKNRCYGLTRDDVVRLARAVSFGHLDGGVLPVLKHIPGHGRAVSDSHLDLPHVSTPHETLSQTDFAAFAALRDLPMAMTAHVVFDAIDAAPATLSKPMINVIRDEIGFDGLLMTDDISMKALSGDMDQIAAQSLDAGCDVVLLCNASLEDRARVAAASGQMTPSAQRRATAALNLRKTPPPLDISAAEDELSALMSGQVYG